ncbi:MAG: hypothetical protein AB1798_22185, partial [Spirochaetota bacterium]
MGVYIQLEIMPDYISSEEWALVYLESLELLNSYPGKMMGKVLKQIGSIKEMLVYSRTLEHETEDPENRHWFVVGDFASQERGESFTMYYDLSHYGKRQPQKQAEDILFQVFEDKVRIPYVFSEKTQGCPYHIPVLAVSMLIESRFPKYALVGGDINLAQAEQARAWAQTVLKHEISLPIKVQGKALYQRLARFYQGKALIEAFTSLFLGSSQEEYETIFELGDKAVIKEWFLQELKDYTSPDQIGATGLFINWLNATGDLKTLAEMACLDEEGPKFDPGKFASALPSTWVTIDQHNFDFFDALSPGDIDTPDIQFGRAFLDLGFKGREIRCHISPDTVISVLSDLFPEHSAQIEQNIQSRADKIKKTLTEMKEPTRKFIQKLESEPQKEGIDDLIFYNPQRPLSDLQQL